MAFTYSPYKNNWNHPYTIDKELILRSSGVPITVNTNGATISDGFQCGRVITMLVNIDSIDYSDLDEDYEIWMQFYDGLAW